MTRLEVLQHLEREGPGLFAMDAARPGETTAHGPDPGGGGG